MQIRKCQLKNFASYEELTFDFSRLGLSLLYGATGVGKSTILDAVSWVLFGVTAKNGNVDEVRSWHNLEEPTYGQLEIETPSGSIAVFRSRGKPSQNDLYWFEECQAVEQRGKDLLDTQRLLNKRLGMDVDLFLSGSYFCEFSPTSQFFMANTKAQREFFESIARLDFPVKLSDRLSDSKKGVKIEIGTLDRKLAEIDGKLSQSKRHLEQSKTSFLDWQKMQEKIIDGIKQKAACFDVDKETKFAQLSEKAKAFDEANDPAPVQARLKELDTQWQSLVSREIKLAEDRCPTCGGPKAKAQAELAKITKQILENRQAHAALKVPPLGVNPWSLQAKILKDSQNTFFDQVAVEEKKINPFLRQLEKLEVTIVELQTALEKETVTQKELYKKQTALEVLLKLSLLLRNEILGKTIKYIETKTNEYLSACFESEIQVSFDFSDVASVDVSLLNGGYSCTYRQLSKGQRCLLKLCFAVAVMNLVSENSHLSSSVLFIDEALDGLDFDCKQKAFALFERLETTYESILIVEHSSEMQNLFTNKFHVKLNQKGLSEIHESSANEKRA